MSVFGANFLQAVTLAVGLSCAFFMVRSRSGVVWAGFAILLAVILSWLAGVVLWMLSFAAKPYDAELISIALAKSSFFALVGAFMGAHFGWRRRMQPKRSRAEKSESDPLLASSFSGGKILPRRNCRRDKSKLFLLDLSPRSLGQMRLLSMRDRVAGRVSGQESSRSPKVMRCWRKLLTFQGGLQSFTARKLLRCLRRAIPLTLKLS